MEPRLMTPADLTWQRLLFNFLSKPGIRAVFVIIVGSMGLSILWVVESKKLGGAKVRSKIPSLKAPFSLEWVIDGTRKNNLIEYGSFVGVLN